MRQNISFVKMLLNPGSEVFRRLTEVENASLEAKDLTDQLLKFSGSATFERKPFCVEASQIEEIADVPQEEMPVVGKGKILLMDDEEIIRLVTGNMLSHLGYEVTCASRGEETVEFYRTAKEKGGGFDLVILDLTIRGGLGGAETMEMLLEIDPCIKAIVSSGYTHDPIMADFGRYGFKGVLPKPYKVRELSVVVHQVMSGQERCR